MDVISALPNVNLIPWFIPAVMVDCALLVLAVFGICACSFTIFECWRYNKWLTTVAGPMDTVADTAIVVTEGGIE